MNSSGTAFVYSGFLGGSGYDSGYGITVDAAGNAYVTGTTLSTNLPTTVGPDTTHNGSDDAFVAKVNSSGTALVYSGFLGGSNIDSGWGIAVDAAGNAYVTGHTLSTDFPATVGPDATHNGGYDAFIAKVNSSGTALVYSGFLGGSNNDSGWGIAVDATGNAYVTGDTLSTSFPTAVGPDTTHNGDEGDAFITKLAAFPGTAGPTLAFRNLYGAIETSTFPTPDLRRAGGVFASDPAIAISPAGRAIFVARDTATPNLGSLYLNWLQPDNTYAAWQPLGGTFQGTPAITTVGESTFIAARDQSGAYWATTFTPGSPVNPWTFLGGVLATDPAIATCPDAAVYLAGRDASGAIWTRRWDSTFASWRDWNSLGGITQGKPSVACGADNAAYVSTRDPYNALWLARVFQESSAVAWLPAAGILHDDTQIVANGTNLHIFALSYSVPWYRTWQIGTGWQPWTQIGGVLAHMSPALYGGNLFLAGQDTTGNVWWWNGLSNSWTNHGKNGVAPTARFSTAYR